MSAGSGVKRQFHRLEVKPSRHVKDIRPGQNFKVPLLAIPRHLHTFAVALVVGLLGSQTSMAQPNDEDGPRLAIHGQTTFIWQSKPGFNAAYTGPNSLSPFREESYSFTLTGDLGLRLWKGAQLHLNPEGAQGVPLSGLLGAGGLSNGELARGSSTSLLTYPARFYIQQRINAGGNLETVEADFNEMGGKFAANRWTLTLGNFSLLDFFDNNPYAKDPREQFANWAFMTHGAWDYAADSRGYTVGAIVEYRTPSWAIRAARVMQPVESNGLALDTSMRHYGDQIEVEGDLPFSSPGGPLRGRALYFSNAVRAGSFAEALALGGVPDVGLVRREQVKTGWGLTLEAPLSEDSGIFLRASRNSGNVETYAFTEIDSQIALGGQFTGSGWGRARDRWGVAYAVNGLSDDHRAYLAAGGLGFFLGDGRLNYDNERVFETYYRVVLPDLNLGQSSKLQSAFSVGFQHITNPGYNRDRGPATTYTFRWHSEF